MIRTAFIAGFIWALALPAFATSGSSDPFAPLTGLDGKPAQLDSAKKQRLVVFWGTWCDECRAKLSKELVQLNQRADVQVVTVNADRDDDRVREFVAKEHIQLPVLRDPTKAFRKELRVFSVPHWALYRKKALGYELVTSEGAFEYGHVVAALEAKTP
jgi:thiol-disulfide isomerase/thioredoxin